MGSINLSIGLISAISVMDLHPSVINRTDSAKFWPIIELSV